MKTIRVSDALAKEVAVLLASKRGAVKSQIDDLTAELEEIDEALAEIADSAGQGPQGAGESAPPTETGKTLPRQSNGKLARGVAEKLVRDAMPSSFEPPIAVVDFIRITGCNERTVRRMLDKLGEVDFAYQENGLWRRQPSILPVENAA